MKAVVFSEAGPSDVLRLVERADPSAGPGEVVVRIARSGVNPTDWKLRAAVGPSGPHDEITPGHDGAGVVEAVGPGVGHVGVGDRVWVVLAQVGRAYGTAAELTVQPANHVVPLPDTASFDLGAALGVPFMTAHRALTSGSVSRLESGALTGQTVLVAGGAGAVGNAAIQLARWAGATVITTVSSAEKAALARAAGAHHVVNYREGDPQAEILAVAPAGVDLVAEVAPVPNLALDLAVTRVHGTVAVYAREGGDDLVLPMQSAIGKNLRFEFLVLYTLAEKLVQAAVADISAALAEGAVRVGESAGLPLHHYGLTELAQAHDAVERGIIGKVLVELD
ncbi:NADPH:quinone reductase-like Zn-dependent oxidoreductase [Nocardia tenerifensis]|uniref:NADPH:quinone reductase-like Zn-dependent oxidoreductase n=1 Tax=Nocardia tenerifensis TaxID=228006 RepID=A0A318KB81_9NOCA|nr:NADPH:quinone reductase [Nocardia tenerifensis]PXX71588.1 NADPH:quinone reductase-like Zn-dependent oxidoreductase [Nocardia tenerifensis]